MKKYLSLILALCLPALLGGCGAVPCRNLRRRLPLRIQRKLLMKCPPTPMNKR